MGRINLARELRASGVNPGELARMAKTGEMRRIRRGAYAPAVADEGGRRMAHLELIEATTRQNTPEAVVSHMSAAALHGLPTWADQLQRVHLTLNHAGNGKIRRHVHLHGIPLRPHAVTMIEGFAVTNLARTVLDLACQLDLWRAVAVGDAALRVGLDPAELADEVERSRRRYGIGRARRAVALLDARSESPQESRSRVIFHSHGLPAPVPQFTVLGRDGLFVARCDFGWPELRTVGEFDGRVKYGRELNPGQDLAEVLFGEKRREDAIRDLDLGVVRWISDDLPRPSALIARLQRAFLRGRPSG